MRFCNTIKFVVLAGVGLVLIGIGGCGPGDVVWKFDGPATTSSPQQEAR